MATLTNTLETIIKGKWEWQSNPDPWSQTESPQWKAYSLDQNYLIEKAYYEQQKEVDLGDYLVYPLDFLQRKKGNPEAQRRIRRINWMDDEEMQNRSARYFDSELPKTINRIFGGLGDFINFFSRRNKEMLEFTNYFKELEKSNDLDILNYKITPKLVECLEEVLLRPLEEQLKNISLTQFKKKILAKAKEKLEELISPFKKQFSSFEEFYSQILRAYTMNTDLYPDLNKYLRDESWIKIDKLLPYAFCLCKAFFNLSLKKNNPGQQDPSTPIILYRGTAFDEFALSFYDKNKIQYFSWNAVTSTTTNIDKAREFMHNSADMEKKKYPVMFIIEVPDLMESEEYLKWLDIRQYSAMPKEDEVILPPGSVFELLEVVTDQDKKTTIKIKLRNEVQSLAHGGLMMQGTLQSQMTTDKEAKIMCLDGEELSQALMSLNGNQLIEEVEFCLCAFDVVLFTKMLQILSTIEKLKTLKLISCICEEDKEITAEKLGSSGITRIEIVEANDFFLIIFNERQNQEYWMSLRELDLDFRSQRSITDQYVAQKVSQELKYLSQLTSLSINFEKCSKITDEGVDSLAKGLNSLTKLTHLTINFQLCHEITDEGVDSLAKSLNSLTQLTHLDLNFECCIKITNEAVNHLIKVLNSLTQLTDLNLNFQCCKRMNCEGMDTLFSQGFKFLSQLKSLKIDFNMAANTSLLCQGLRSLTQLTSLTLRSLEYDDEELNSFACDGLKYLTSLQSLTLGFFQHGNEITDKGVEILASQGLKSLVSLTSLDIGFAGFDQITDKGVHDLARQGLKHLVHLKSLFIEFSSCCEITEEGVGSLMSQGLTNLTQLTSLILDFTFCDEITNNKIETLASTWLRSLPIFESLIVENQMLQSIHLRTPQEQLKNSPRVYLARESSKKDNQPLNEGLMGLLPENYDGKMASNSSGPFSQSNKGISQDLLDRLVSISNKNENETHNPHSALTDLEIFTKIQHLSSLTLKFENHQNAITDEFVHNLASQALRHCPQLRFLTLDLYDCSQISDKGIYDLALYGLRSLTFLESLTLFFGSRFPSRITDKGISALAWEGLGRLPQLKSLKLSFSGLKKIIEKGVSDLALYGLKPLVNLVSLTLDFHSCSEIRDKALLDLASKGLRHLSGLKSLNLSFTGCKRITDKGVRDLASHGLKPLTDLASLNLDFSYYNQITDEGLIDLAREGLRHLSRLKSLNLSFSKCSGITDEGWMNLAWNGLTHLSQLESLVLLPNEEITDKGVSDIAVYGLKPLTNLLSLNLEIPSDQITDEGMAGLVSEGLKNLSRLQSLSLNLTSCKTITDQGWINLAWDGLKNLSQLESLVLKPSMEIRDEGVDILVSRGLKYLIHLKSLSLGFCEAKITDKGVNKLILQVVKNLRQLTSLDLDFFQVRNISDLTVQNIIKVLHYFGFTKEIVAN